MAIIFKRCGSGLTDFGHVGRVETEIGVDIQDLKDMIRFTFESVSDFRVGLQEEKKRETNRKRRSMQPSSSLMIQ